MMQDTIDAPELAPVERSGRATWDARGNSIWEWEVRPGVFAREIDSNELDRLASNLCLVDHPSLMRNFEGLWVHDRD